MDLIAKHQQWMTDRGLAPSYITARGRSVRAMAAAIRCRPENASEAQLLEWRAGLTQGPDTICEHVMHVREFLRWCVAKGYRKTSPAEAIPVPRRIKRLPRPIADTHLISAMLEADRPMRLMLALIGWAGLRCCEIAGLRWESVDLDSAYMIVTAETAKGSRERIVPLCPQLIGELRRYGYQATGWVFARLDGAAGPNKAYTISNRINTYLHGRGLRDTAHAGRHRFATKLLDQGANLREVQELLGHENIASTSIYTKVTLVSTAAAVAALPWSA